MEKLSDGRVWRNSQELRGVRSQLVAALNRNVDGAEEPLDLKTISNLIQVCDQAIHTEVGHEPC